MSNSNAQQREDDQMSAGDRHDDAVTAAQVEESLNKKNVEVVLQGDRSATLLPDEAVDALRGVGADAEDAWVPDHETGVFVPAEEAAANGHGDDGLHEQTAGPSVLDQTVFVRDDMEDVERPPVDMAGADAK